MNCIYCGDKTKTRHVTGGWRVCCMNEHCGAVGTLCVDSFLAEMRHCEILSYMRIGKEVTVLVVDGIKNNACRRVDRHTKQMDGGW